MPKRTFQPKKGKRRNTHGFLSRNQSKNGRAILKRRQIKGRKKLAP